MGRLKQILSPILWVVGFQAISAGIGFVTSSNIDGWYSTLQKPALNPPDIAFPIVWTTLYVLIALTGWKIWAMRHNPKARFAVILYVLYVALNWSWSFIFFEFHLICTAFFWIVAINVVNCAFIVKSWPISRFAAIAMIPPLLWTMFAGFLNYQIWQLN